MAYSDLHQAIDRLNEAQAEAVRAFFAMLADDDQDLDHEDATDAGDVGNRRQAAGWVELKTIGGYGPYAYRRWRDGRTLRSKYIGKVDLGSNGNGAAGKVAP